MTYFLQFKDIVDVFYLVSPIYLSISCINDTINDFIRPLHQRQERKEIINKLLLPIWGYWATSTILYSEGVLINEEALNLF